MRSDLLLFLFLLSVVLAMGKYLSPIANDVIMHAMIEQLPMLTGNGISFANCAQSRQGSPEMVARTSPFLLLRPSSPTLPTPFHYHLIKQTFCHKHIHSPSFLPLRSLTQRLKTSRVCLISALSSLLAARHPVFSCWFISVLRLDFDFVIRRH